jgi:hypothetical protein
VIEHRSDDEQREARGLLNDLKGGSTSKKRKRAAGEGRTQAKKARGGLD